MSCLNPEFESCCRGNNVVSRLPRSTAGLIRSKNPALGNLGGLHARRMFIPWYLMRMRIVDNLSLGQIEDGLSIPVGVRC